MTRFLRANRGRFPTEVSLTEKADQHTEPFFLLCLCKNYHRHQKTTVSYAGKKKSPDFF